MVKAAEKGKTVIAIIELKARFDEENNVQLARVLEKAGVQVAYGLVDLKVHSKLSLITRKENNKLVSYAHCGTAIIIHQLQKYIRIFLFSRQTKIFVMTQ